MATVFGISGLRSRLADWRDNWKFSVPWPTTSRNAYDPANDRELSRVIENLVIPRLIAGLDDSMAKTDAIRSDPGGGLPSQISISKTDIAAFARLSLDNQPEAMLDYVDAQLALGCSVETLYIDLLAPAARELGREWETDSLDFVEVTMGLWRIQEVLRELSARVPPKVAQRGMRPAALFAPIPGEQHSFGTLMVGDCFERAGWQVDVLIEPGQSELNTHCAERFYDLIGLTVTSDCTSGSLRSLVTTLRAISRNPDVRIMVGGRFINEHPEFVALSGADATAEDAVSAIALAEQLVRSLPNAEVRL